MLKQLFSVLAWDAASNTENTAGFFLIFLSHNDLFPQQWAVQMTFICSHVISTICWFYSDILQILLLHKTWEIITNLTRQSRQGYIIDMSKYHNVGIWSMDQKILSVMFKNIKHLGQSVIIPISSKQAAGSTRILWDSSIVMCLACLLS